MQGQRVFTIHSVQTSSGSPAAGAWNRPRYATDPYYVHLCLQR